MILKRIAPIRDILHGYMEFSPYEGYIIDTPYFQRLHWVHQTGFSFVTYPNSQNSRFAHSLGVAHLAGRIYLSALSHAKSSTLNNFLKDACQLIKFSSKNMLGDGLDYRILESIFNWWKKSEHKKTIPYHYPIIPEEGRLNFHTNIEIYEKQDNNEARYISKGFVLDIIGISIKIYALLHDIGHLPVGHIFEYALHDAYINCETYFGNPSHMEENGHIFQHMSKTASAKDILSSLMMNVYINQQNNNDDMNRSIHSETGAKDLHEIRGYYIMKRIYEDIKKEKDESNEAYFMMICMSISIIIALSEHIDISKYEEGLDLVGAQKILSSLHSIVDSDVDADRLDYVMRDAQTSGIDIVKYDIDRIVDSYILLDEFKIHGVEKDLQESKYLFSLGKKSISSLEVFFNQRKVLYDTLISHKSVLKSNASLQEALACIFEVVFIYMSYDSFNKQVVQITDKIIEILDRFDWVTTEKKDNEKIAGKIKYILGHEIDRNYALTSSNELSNALIYIDDAQMKTILLAIKNYLNRIDLSEYASNASDNKSKRMLLLLSRIPLLVDVSINRRFDYVSSFVKTCIDVRRRGWDVCLKNNPYEITKKNIEKEIIRIFKDEKYNNKKIATGYNKLKEESQKIMNDLIDILKVHKRENSSNSHERDVIFIYTFTRDAIYHNGQFIFCYFDEEGYPIVDDLINLSPFLRSLKESVHEMDHFDFYVSRNMRNYQEDIECRYRDVIMSIDKKKGELIKNFINTSLSSTSAS